MKSIWGVEISLGKSMLDYIKSEEDCQKARRNFDRALKGSDFSEIEEYGEEQLKRQYYENIYTPFLDENGEVLGLTVFVIDITKTERIQNILKESESRLKNISDSVPGAVLRYKINPNLKAEVLFFSEGAENLWKVSREEVMRDAKILWEPVHPDDKDSLRRSALLASETGSPWNHEWRLLDKKGTVKWVNGRGLPNKSSDGSVIWDTLILDITEQKETLIQLDESQKLLESINQNINEGIYRSRESGVIYVNKAFLRMFGYDSLEDLKNVGPEEIYYTKGDRKRVMQILHQKGFFENEEIRFLRKDGTDFIGLISSRVYKDYQGNTFWDGAIRDVTDEIKAQKRVEQSQQLLESINKNINEAIYRSINRKGLIYVNEEFVKMFGYENTEELMSADPKFLYKNPEDRRILGDELVAKGSYVNREVEFRRKDGSTFWGSISSIMINGEDGNIYFDGAIRNISLQKEAEFALRRQADTQKLLRNISSNFINLPLDRVNEAIDRSLEALGKFADADRAYVFDVYEDENYCINTFEWVREGIKPAIDELQYVPLDEVPEAIAPYLNGENEIIPDVEKLEDSFFKQILKGEGVKSLIGVPMLQNGQCVGFVGFDAVRHKKNFSEEEISMLSIFSDMMLNIRNRAQNQIELKKLLNTTTDQNKRLKEFSFMTSHNIRSSVSNMLGLTKLILEEPNNTAYLELLNKAAEKLDTTIKNINQLLHFENNFQTKELVFCNLMETVNRILELNQKIIDDKDIELDICIPEDLELYAIPAFLDSIFYNLLSNAFKYGVTRHSKKIEIKHQGNDEEDIIFIKDHGWGIDLNKYRDKLFKLGSRLHISSEGQGLGLYMTKHQIEEMGGSIEIESEVDVGTTFILTFAKSNRQIYKKQSLI